MECTVQRQMRCVFERRADREGYLRDVSGVRKDGVAQGEEISRLTPRAQNKENDG